jgi:hypothetical protein
MAGSVSTSANLSIAIGPALPLAFTTPSPLPSGGAEIYYNTTISVSGGLPPFTYTVAPGSAPLPSALSLDYIDVPYNPVGISGMPSAAGTSNVALMVTDSQSPPASATATYSFTFAPSTNYVATQAPGDVWQIAVSDTNATDGLLGFQDQGKNGLTGPISWQPIDDVIVEGAGTFSTVTTGFKKMSISNQIQHINPFTVPNYLVEIPGSMLASIPSAVTYMDWPGGPYREPGNVIAAAANACPQLSGATNFQYVALADTNFDLTQDAYGVATFTQTAANRYNLAFNAFLLDGSAGTANAYSGLACDNNLQVFAFTNAAGTPSTVAVSASGLMVVDNGTGISAIGIQQPAVNLSPAAILGAQYLGAVFYVNQTQILAGCRPAPINYCFYYNGPTTDAVGFGPGSEVSIAGGVYENIDSDAFSDHGTDHVITLGTQTSPGLFPGGTLTIGSNTLQNFDVTVGQINGKFVMLGVTADSTASPIQPYVVLLVQQ